MQLYRHKNKGCYTVPC